MRLKITQYFIELFDVEVGQVDWCNITEYDPRYLQCQSDMGSIQFRNWNWLFLKNELELRNFELEMRNFEFEVSYKKN